VIMHDFKDLILWEIFPTGELFFVGIEGKKVRRRGTRSKKFTNLVSLHIVKKPFKGNSIMPFKKVNERGEG